LKESEKCVYKPSKEKSAGCKAWPPQFGNYMMGRWASGTLSSYSIPSTDQCPVELNLTPGGRNLRQLEPSSQECYDVDFWRFEIEETMDPCGDPFSVEFTATASYAGGTKPNMLPVVFSNIDGANCAGITPEAPRMGNANLDKIGAKANGWRYTMWLAPGWYTVAMFAVIPEIDETIPEWAIVGECRGDESEYTFRMIKGEPPEMNVEETPDVSLLELIDGILFTYDIIPEDGSSQAVANSNDE